MTRIPSYSLPVGPQHPGLLEPEHFSVRVDGEEVVGVDLRLGYMHRGIEAGLLQKDYIRDLYLVERVCGICSAHHTLVYTEAVERLLGVEPPARAKYIRVIMAEMERLHNHFLWLGFAGYEIGLDTLFHLAWRDREHVMALLEAVSGGRVNNAMNAIGGVRRDIPSSVFPKLRRLTHFVEERAAHYAGMVAEDRTIRKRTEGIGVLERKEAVSLSSVGPTARGSGLNYDVRSEGYEVYSIAGFKPVLQQEGDVKARLLVRMGELAESASMIRKCLTKMPKTELRVKQPLNVPENEAIARVEAPRGELFYYARSDGSDKPARVKIRTPTIMNILALKPMLLGQQLADLPIIVSSIDPCFACTDRVTVIDNRTEKQRTMTGTELRRMSR